MVKKIKFLFACVIVFSLAFNASNNKMIGSSSNTHIMKISKEEGSPVAIMAGANLLGIRLAMGYALSLDSHSHGQLQYAYKNLHQDLLKNKQLDAQANLDFSEFD